MTAEAATTGEAELHAILAAWLVRAFAVTPAQAVARHGVDAVPAACEREGVVSLVHARLSEIDALHPVPLELMERLTARARLCAARSLLCLSEARRIQRALHEAGIPTLWLKGIALGQWLYPSAHLRDIADIDLLLPDHATTLRAAQVLAPLGYALPNPHIAGDLVVHELLAWSSRAQLELDLHWDLSNDALFANRLDWQRLHGGARALPALGDGTRGLCATDALLHACMHRAVNHLTRRENRLRWLYDIHLLWTGLDPEEQTKAIAVAIRARLADPLLGALLACGMRFGATIDELGLARLRDAAACEPLQSERLRSWSYFQQATLRTLTGVQKLRWMRQVLFPNAAHMKVRYGLDGAGQGRILVRRLRDGIGRWRGYIRR